MYTSQALSLVVMVVVVLVLEVVVVIGQDGGDSDRGDHGDRTGICLGMDMTISAYYFGILKFIMHPF